MSHPKGNQVNTITTTTTEDDDEETVEDDADGGDYDSALTHMCVGVISF